MKTNKVLKIMVCLLIAVLAAVLVLSGMYLRKQYDRTTYFQYTTINGIDASDKTPQDICDELTAKYSASTVTLVENGTVEIEGSLAEFGYTIDGEMLLESLESKLASQRTSIIVLIENLMHAGSYTVTVPFVFSQTTFNEKVCAQQMKDARVENRNATLEYNEEENVYYIEPEVQGTGFNDADLQSSVKAEIDKFVSGNNPGKDLETTFPEGIYIQPEVTSDDADLNMYMNIYNSFCKAVVRYQFGDEEEVLDWSTIQNWIMIENGEGVLSQENLQAYVTELAAKYNTLHYDRTFHTTAGADIVIEASSNDYGYLVNEEEEVTQLAADILSNTEVSREPVYYATNSSYGNPYYYKRNGTDDLAGTYVEIDLTKQHLWFYKDGELIIESDLVSGSVAKGTETITGAFPLAYKESPSTLVGADAADGYRTEVQYWMPFYDGQGLHDASWRSSFGGSIYQTNGSHGCVNLPPAAAKTIYENIEAGMAIILYQS